MPASSPDGDGHIANGLDSTRPQASPLFRAITTRQCTRGDCDGERCARQIRNAAGLAVFVSARSGRAQWVEAGRCYERFALQATALGIRNAMLNPPVEVGAVRSQSGAWLGLGPDERPDLLVRFGRGPGMPLSMRRPVRAVVV